MKRLLSANSSEILQMSAEELKQSIKASEGRVLLSENVVFRECYIDDITNAEVARSFGADMILLNGLDVLEPSISGLPDSSEEMIDTLHHLVGCPIGVNLEPVDSKATMLESQQELILGRRASKETFQAIEQLGFDFVCLTGNPGTGVSNQEILSSISLAKEHFSGLIIAGKMHGAGVAEPVVDSHVALKFVDAGADIVLVPAVGTVPGLMDLDLHRVVQAIHEKGALVMSAIGTSQESADEETIKQIALRNKVCGVDIQHIGDAGYGGLAPVENIFAMSLAIRGMRHTVSRIARSINR